MAPSGVGLASPPPDFPNSICAGRKVHPVRGIRRSSLATEYAEDDENVRSAHRATRAAPAPRAMLRPQGAAPGGALSRELRLVREAHRRARQAEAEGTRLTQRHEQRERRASKHRPGTAWCVRRQQRPRARP